jgi:hypothetical protein
MKDSQIIILTSFLTALKLHQESLPNDIITQLQEIAKNLESKVRELDAIAENYPTLKPLYHSAYQSLLSRSSQRKMGQGFYPSDEPEEDETMDNMTRDIRPEVERIEKDLDIIIKATKILSSDNPTETARQEFN